MLNKKEIDPHVYYHQMQAYTKPPPYLGFAGLKPALIPLTKV